MTLDGNRSEQKTAARTLAAALFVLTVLIFARACTNGFVNYDDPDYVTANSRVLAGLSPDGVRWALTAQEASNWHPLTWMSHMTDVSLFGRVAGGHHATSVLLHALNAALAFVVLRRLTGAIWPSAIVAAWFAWHPLRVESVAWISERKDVLSAFWFFVSLWCWTHYAERRGGRSDLATANASAAAGFTVTYSGSGWGWYALALAAFALGLTAKPMLVTLPCVLLLLDYWPLCRFQRDGAVPLWRSTAALLIEKLPFFALVTLSCILTYAAQKHGGSVSNVLDFAARLENALVAVLLYVGLLLWPAKLAPLYPHPGAWPAALVVSAAAFIACVSVLAWLQRRRQPWLLVGWLWFLGMLVPVLGLVQVGLQSMADRYTYLPSLGFGLAAVWAWRHAGFPRPAWAGAIAFAALAVTTIVQTGVWRDSLTLFSHTIAVAGENNYLAYDNRGIAWGDAGEPEKAIADYRQSLAIHPTYANANNNLARALAEQGRLHEAVPLYRAALKAKPDDVEIHNNFANALADAGNVAEAMEHYRFVLARNPNHANALNGYAVALASTGQLAEAEKQFRRVLELDPSNRSATSNLGNVYALLGRHADAESVYRQVLASEPKDDRSWINLGNVLLQQGRFADAVAAFSRAVSLRPTHPDAQAALGFAYLRTGQREEAIRHLQLALQQRPDFPQAKAWLDAARAERR